MNEEDECYYSDNDLEEVPDMLHIAEQKAYATLQSFGIENAFD